MLQELETTIRNLTDRRLKIADTRLHTTIMKYASEIMRDLTQTEWRTQCNGGLNAGYILCLTGETAKGIGFIEKSLQMHETQKGEYDESTLTILGEIIETLKEFGANKDTISKYEKQVQKQETDNTKDLRKEIAHIEADMECSTGDLNKVYSDGRRAQGILYQQLGEHEQAISHFQKAIEEDTRDWRNETSIENELSIVDSYLEIDDCSAAAQEFMTLMSKLLPNKLKSGDKIPNVFTENYQQFVPYLEKLNMKESLGNMADYVRARLEILKKIILPPSPEEDHKEHWKRTELCTLSRILASYHVSREEYQQASDIYDEAREYLRYQHNLSRRDQAEFAIRAGNTTKARQLVKEDTEEKDSLRTDDDKPFELTNLHLQLGDVETALNTLDKYCETYKQCLISGSYGCVFETRRMQIAIIKAAMGKEKFNEAIERLRKDKQTSNRLNLNNLLQKGRSK